MNDKDRVVLVIDGDRIVADLRVMAGDNCVIMGTKPGATIVTAEAVTFGDKSPWLDKWRAERKS